MQRRTLLYTLLFCPLFFFATVVGAAEINVMISGGFSAAYANLVPEFERATGHKVTTVRGPSMGNTPQAIPNRLRRGEPADALIMVGYALDNLAKDGKVVPESRVALARSVIAMAIRAGAPSHDIRTLEALKQTLLAAKSIAYSDSASGVYISTEMLPKLGIADQVSAKARMIPGEPVGRVVARGEAEIGFQPLSELMPVSGIEIVGPLPPEVQKEPVFSAGITTSAREPQAAAELIGFLASPAALPIIRKAGMEPAPGKD
jgi:molybdate transport system substrate-binding protein